MKEIDFTVLELLLKNPQKPGFHIFWYFWYTLMTIEGSGWLDINFSMPEPTPRTFVKIWAPLPQKCSVLSEYSHSGGTLVNWYHWPDGHRGPWAFWTPHNLWGVKKALNIPIPYTNIHSAREDKRELHRTKIYIDTLIINCLTDFTGFTDLVFKKMEN